MLHNQAQAQKYHSLDKWFKTPQGLAIAKAFITEMSCIDRSLYGGTFLQIGSCAENIWLPFLRFKHKWIVSPYFNKKNTLCASLNKLPIDRDSIDCILAPLTMEASQNDIVLDEIDRILKPMGIVIFFGINPLSLWGLGLKWGYLECFGKADTRLQSSLTLKRNMSYRGFKSLIHKNFYFIPPVVEESLIHKLNFLNEMGKMIWPFPAGFYCLILQKFQYNQIWNLEVEDYLENEPEIEYI